MRCESCREFVDLEGAKFCPSCGETIPEPPPDPIIGSLVGGRYRVKSLVAEGGMGRVYSAEQTMGGAIRKVAIKVLMTTYAGREVDMKRFARECSTVAELEHPNTIKFYDYGATDLGDPYIAMEFLSGAALSQVLREGPLPAERVDVIIGQICGSLQEAHDRGIIHRDLKPDNIILTTPGGQADFVKVLDFGIAKRLGGVDTKLTPLGVVLGSPPYMSPEQFTLQDIDARSDIYSLAVLSFQALTGKLPFMAHDPLEWAHLHINTTPLSFEVTEAGRFVPDSMRQAILKAMSKRPADRQASMREFYAEFTTGVTLPQGRLPSLVPIAPELLALANAASPRRASSRPPPMREESPRPMPFAPMFDDLSRSSSPDVPRRISDEPTRESDMRRPSFSASAPSIVVSELRPSALSLPEEEFAPRTEETPEPRFGRAGTVVMAASEPPPRAPVRPKLTMPDLLPPTVRDPEQLRRTARGATGAYVVLGGSVLVVLGAVMLGVWFFFLRERPSTPSRPPRVSHAAPAPSPSAAEATAPTPSSEPRETDSAHPKDAEPSPCQNAVYAAVSGRCDAAKRAYASCGAESPYYPSAQRTMSGLCP